MGEKAEGNFSHGGSGSGYANYGCRCDECTEANRRRVKRRRDERRSEPLPKNVKHGLACYNNWACRCPICSEAARINNQKYRAKQKELKGIQPLVKVLDEVDQQGADS